MADYIRAMGILTRRAIKSHAFDRLMTSAAGYFISKVKLTDLKAKRAFVRRKRADHLTLLGKTVFRLVQNDIEILNNERIEKISMVLDDINHELDAVEAEIERRSMQEKKKSPRPTSSNADERSPGTQ